MGINKISLTSFILSDFINTKSVGEEEMTDEISLPIQTDFYDDTSLLNFDVNDLSINNVKQESIQNKSIEEEKILNANNATIAETTNDDVDWNALMIEGKGINVANISKVLYNSFQKEIEQNGKHQAIQDSILNILTNGTSEEKDAVAKLFSYPTVNKSYDVLDKAWSLFRYTNNMKSEAEVLSKLASLDKDGDGFLSDQEIENISKTKYLTQFGLQSDGVTLASCGDACAKKFQKYGITTINGQKCYCMEGLVITEEEYSKLNAYYEENGKEASFAGALEAMGIENKQLVEKDKGTNSQKDYISFVGDSGVASEILTAKKYKRGKTQDISEDKQLWLLYMGIKYKYGV